MPIDLEAVAAACPPRSVGRRDRLDLAFAFPAWIETNVESVLFFTSSHGLRLTPERIDALIAALSAIRAQMDAPQ